MQQIRTFSTILLAFVLTACPFTEPSSSDEAPQAGRLVQFIGVDISGSFKSSEHFPDSLTFLAHYIYAHLNGIGDTKIPHSLFVGSIGGVKANEPKTFYPIHEFKYKSIDQIHKTLLEIFPQQKTNKFTDYNAFFKQVETTVKTRKLLMKPLDIILLSDGIPDAPKKNDYRSLDLSPLENLTRNVTVRLLYTSAEVGMNWLKKVPRKRVRVWTQDGNVMRSWKSATIFQKDKAFEDQKRFFEWLKDNVDFPARITRVN